MAEKHDGRKTPENPAGKPGDKERRAFATAIARAEFGRFYWSDSAEKALDEARRKRPPKQKA